VAVTAHIPIALISIRFVAQLVQWLLTKSGEQATWECIKSLQSSQVLIARCFICYFGKEKCGVWLFLMTSTKFVHNVANAWYSQKNFWLWFFYLSSV